MANKKDDNTDDKEDQGKSTRRISKEEAAFILGAQGRTKTKLANVSGTQIDLVELKGGQSQLEVSGSAKLRARAMKYIDYVILQRSGPVKIDESSHPDDLTILRVPADTVSFITGTKGAYLRHVEDEMWTLLFFLHINPKQPPAYVDPKKMEILAIFGPHRQRRGAELKVMAAIENKLPGYFTKNAVPKTSDEDEFNTDTMLISNDDYSYALGKNGNTRKKLARASNCIVEYIGRMVYFSGLKIERKRAKEYLQWLLHQRVGESAHVDYKGRDDVTMIMVQRNCIGYVTGSKGASLRAIEEETNTFCFIEGGADETDDSQKPLLIFGRNEDRRFAESLVWERMSHKIDELADNGKDGRKGKGRGKGDNSKGKAAYGITAKHPIFFHWVEKSGKNDGKSDGNGKGDNYFPEPERPVGKDITSDFEAITDEDAAFITGTSGKTKRKLAAVSGAFLKVESNQLEITGKPDQKQRAHQYVRIVMKQRLGPVTYKDIECHTDLTIIEVPAEAVSFVTDKGGVFLRIVEEEFGTLLFYLDCNKSGSRDQPERLAIFGSELTRRGAELKVMAAIEMKQAGYFMKKNAHLPMVDPQEGFSTDRMPIAEDDYSYALGKGGSTRKKIARASGCIIEYVGRQAYLSGCRPERKRAREYLGWLFRQRVGPVEVNYDGRDDVIVLPVPKDCVGFITGHKGTSLRLIEDTTGTFCFIEGGRDDPHRDPKPLLIFGTAESRKQAEALLQQRIEQKLEAGWVHEDWNGSGYGNGNGGTNSGKGNRHHNDRDGTRRPPREKGGGKAAQGDRWSTDNRSQAFTHGSNEARTTTGEAEQSTQSAVPGTTPGKAKEQVAEQEEDEAWGDWGGASDSDGAEEPATNAITEAVASTGDMKPGGHPPGAARWSDNPVPMQFKAERLKGEQELELPPQLLHEEAWPELGGMGGPKKGGKKR